MLRCIQRVNKLQLNDLIDNSNIPEFFSILLFLWNFTYQSINTIFQGKMRPYSIKHDMIITNQKDNS